MQSKMENPYHTRDPPRVTVTELFSIFVYMYSQTPCSAIKRRKPFWLVLLFYHD